MPDIDTLKSRLKVTPYLVADGASGEVALVSESRAFRMMYESGMFPTQTITNAGQALTNFTRLTGETDRHFTLSEIKTIAGVPYSQAYNWLMEGVLEPSVRPRCGSGKGRDVIFNFADAYTAGLLGSLRRQGLPLDILRKIQPLFLKPVKKKSRTGRKAVTSGRP